MTQYVINIGAIPNDGTGDPLRTAFNETNLNFNQVFAAGPVLSNIRIANNNIFTTNTNGNLVLNPNGTGVVQANAHVVPNLANIRNLGSATRRWSELYVQYANIAGSVDLTGTLGISGDLTVGGNLTVVGNTIQIGNITTETKTIQLANAASTANAATGSGVTVGVNDDIATMLYSSASNSWVMNIGIDTPNIVVNNISSDDSTFVTVQDGLDVQGSITAETLSAAGNITGNYFIGNGSQLTGLPASYGNANVVTLLAGFGSNTISTTGNISGGFILGNLAFANGLPATYSNANAVAYGQSGWAGNIIPAGNAVYSLGNATNQWNDLYVSNTTIFMNNVPISLGAGNVLTVGGNAVLQNNSNTTISTTGNVTANYFFGNGSQLSGLSTSSISNGTSNVNIPTANGNVSITANAASTWTFGNDGRLNLPDAGGDGVSIIQSNYNIEIGANGTPWNFANDGNLTLPRGGVVYETNIPGGVLSGNTIALKPQGGTSTDQQLLIYPTADPTADANHLHLTSGNLYNTELFLGNDDLYVKLANTGNILINSNDDVGNTAQWIFGTTGTTIFPTLTVTRGDRSGTLTGQALLFGDSTQEALISTPNGTADINDSQRIVINPGAGYANTTGEGGDIYLYAGRGGDAGGSGGDIKIRGGLGPVDGAGGYLDIMGGEAAGNGVGGRIDMQGGESVNSTGGDINITGGQGISGGDVNIQSGNGTAGPGGDLTLKGGVSSNGLAAYGNVVVNSGASSWQFNNIGNLSAPGNVSAVGNVTAGNVLTGGLISATGNITGGNLITAGSGGNITMTGGNITGANVVTANSFVGNGATLSNVATQVTGSWPVPVGNSTQSFTVPINNTYQLWVLGNIPNGIIVYNATVSVSNTNVPVIGQQFAWNYEGGGNILMFTSIPAQIVGTAGTISNAAPAVANTNVFTFGINNTSGNTVTVNYGYTKIS